MPGYVWIVDCHEHTAEVVPATFHPMLPVMNTYHPLAIAGEAAETSSNTQCAFRQLCFRIISRRRLCFEDLLKTLAASPLARNT